MNSGRLELIIGPMYASKSTEVIRRVNRYRAKKLNVLVINHTINNRYGSNHITTHDSMELKCCLIVDNLDEVLQNQEMYQESQVIVIEELQFFSDAFQFVTRAVDTDNKLVIAAGLIADFKRGRFGQVLDLVPHADEITHLKAYCSLCDSIVEAPFTKRIIDEDRQELVGSQECYIPVCRYHYLQKK